MLPESKTDTQPGCLVGWLRLIWMIQSSYFRLLSCLDQFSDHVFYLHSRREKVKVSQSVSLSQKWKFKAGEEDGRSREHQAVPRGHVWRAPDPAGGGEGRGDEARPRISPQGDGGLSLGQGPGLWAVERAPWPEAPSGERSPETSVSGECLLLYCLVSLPGISVIFKPTYPLP